MLESQSGTWEAARLLLRFLFSLSLPRSISLCLFGLAKHLVNRSGRRMSLTAENLIYPAKEAKNKTQPGHSLRKAQQIDWSQFQFQFQFEVGVEVASNRNWTTHVRGHSRRSPGQCIDFLLAQQWLVSVKVKGDARTGPGCATLDDKAHACRLLVVASSTPPPPPSPVLCVWAHRSHPCSRSSGRNCSGCLRSTLLSKQHDLCIVLRAARITRCLPTPTKRPIPRQCQFQCHPLMLIYGIWSCIRCHLTGYLMTEAINLVAFTHSCGLLRHFGSLHEVNSLNHKNTIGLSVWTRWSRQWEQLEASNFGGR